MNETPAPMQIHSRRERVIETLCKHVADDVLDLDEFERRVDRAHRAVTVEELDALVADLPAVGIAPHPAPASAPPPAHRRDHQLFFALMSETVRRGGWTPPRRATAFAFMGDITLDFRDTHLPPGVTEITAVSIWAGIEIIVPPGVVVESDGVAIMGAFDHHANAPAAYAPDAPILRIRGIALMAAVEVHVRLPGESARDARRRLKEERRRLRDQQRRLHGGA